MDPSVLTNYFNTILVVTTIAAGAFGILNRETIRTLRESNKDLVDRVSLLEANEVRLKTNLNKIANENKILRTVITNDARLASIEKTQKDHHDEARIHWQEINSKLDRILNV